MNFPIQACSICGEATENLYCPNCRRKLGRDEIKVFWTPQSWSQYRATVLDFQSFSSSLPYLETRVLDSPPEDEQPPARRMGLLVGLVAAVLVGCVALALWFSRVNSRAEVQDIALEKARQQGRKDGAVPERRTLKPTPRVSLRRAPRAQAPGGFPYLDPQAEEACGAQPHIPEPPPLPEEVEDTCGAAQPEAPNEGFSGSEVPDEPEEELTEDMSQAGEQPQF